MAKRKSYKRSRRKQSLHESQESLLQNSDTSDETDSVVKGYTPPKKKLAFSERLLQQRSPESVLFESEQPDLSCYDDLSPEIVPRRRRMKLDLNGSDKDEKEEKNRIKNEPEMSEAKQVNNLLKKNIETPEKCFSLNKTLSMNDEIKLEMNDCQSLQQGKSFSKAGLDVCTCSNELRSSKSAYDFPCGYTSEPAQFTNFNSESEAQNHGFHNFLDEFQSTFSGCESAGRSEDKWDGQGQGTKFEIVDEKNSQESSESRIASNWSECRRILSNLRQINSFKVRTANQEFFGNPLPKYKKLDETRSLQTSSFSYYTSSSLTSEENSNERANKRPFVEADKNNDKVDDERDYNDVKSNGTKIRARSVTPCSGSPPPAKRCRTTLKFDDEDEVEEARKPVVTVTVADLLPMEKKNVQNCFYPSTITKTRWSNGSPESPTTSILDLPVVSDSGSCSRCLQETERQVELSKKCTCTSFQQNKKSRRFQAVRKSITKIILFCAWILKRTTATVKNSYESLKRAISMSSSTRRQMEELSQVVIILRSENEQMISTFLEKVTLLSDEIAQVRASNTTALGALTAEVSGMQEASKKLAGSNETLMQELKRLHQMLEDTRSKSPKKPLLPPLLMPSILISTPSAAPPPPPPPPPPAPPLPPPPPPLPSSQSPAQPITPTTPSSGRSVRTPSRKCSTPLFNRPAITVEDLLKVTLKKAPQNVKENRRNTIPGPRGPVISLDMLRSVKLKSARRRTADQIARSPRSARMIKARTAPSLSLSPIMKGADNSLGRILKQVDINRRGPRRLLSSTSFRESSIGKDNQSQCVEAKDSGSRSAIA